MSLLALLITAIVADPLSPPTTPIQATEVKVKLVLKRPGLQSLEVVATYPKSGGPYPVIVFSHGMYGAGELVRPVAEYWAKHGYVVLAPTHDDSLKYASAQQIRSALQGNLDNLSSAPQRPRDINLLLDNTAELIRQAPDLKGKMDLKRVGMSGHSFGAWTTQVVAGMSLGGRQVGDPRPQAFVVLSPSGLGGGITPSSLKSMRGPMLFVSGDNDRGRFQGEPGVYRREAFRYSAEGDRYLVWIKDAFHNFGGINATGREGQATHRRIGRGLMGPANPDHVVRLQVATLAFWDATLKQSAPARAWLDNRTIEAAGGVTITKK